MAYCSISSSDTNFHSTSHQSTLVIVGAVIVLNVEALVVVLSIISHYQSHSTILTISFTSDTCIFTVAAVMHTDFATLTFKKRALVSRTSQVVQ
jgi:hypothetical protein